MSARPLYLLFAILLAAAGLAAATCGRVQARLAQTELSMATQQYARADEELRGLEWLQRFAGYLPAGREVLAEIRSRQAEIRYWQGDYRKREFGTALVVDLAQFGNAAQLVRVIANEPAQLPDLVTGKRPIVRIDRSAGRRILIEDEAGEGGLSGSDVGADVADGKSDIIAMPLGR